MVWVLVDWARGLGVLQGTVAACAGASVATGWRMECVQDRGACAGLLTRPDLTALLTHPLPEPALVAPAAPVTTAARAWTA